MRSNHNILIWGLFTPLLSLAFWLFTVHTLVHFMNLLFYISIILTIIFFIIIIVQEGVLDPTSYGFRRLKYQLSSQKHRDALEKDTFFKPGQVKKEHYFITPWVITGFVCNIIYLLCSISISFML
ncbi:hypothetical protein AST12_04045 [Staphylococcus succinus]|nr:hypothetical protein AST12_04045 [Staphylococcus succinus]PTI41412.1 DUF3899 domain-containing protein [Staphylococcus succinus]